MTSDTIGLIFIGIAVVVLPLSIYKIRHRKSFLAIFATLLGFLVSLVSLFWGAFLLLVGMDSN
jgi:hypothetical protein